jgi:hypothetical protein
VEDKSEGDIIGDIPWFISASTVFVSTSRDDGADIPALGDITLIKD